MEFSSLVDRIGGEAAAAWDIHFEARRAQGLGRDVIVLSVGDPDFPTPSGIVERAVSALESGDTHYAEISGRSRLREAIAGRLAERHGLPVDTGGVMPFAGTQNAMFATCLCLFERGDEVLAFDPMYLTYEATVRASGAEVVRVPVVGDGSFRPDVEALVEAATPQTKGIVLTTPANPTGVMMTRAELELVADLARSRDLWVLSDEVYADLVFESEHHSIGALAGMQDRTVTMGSLSKSHAMTGWRIGWAAGPEVLMPHLHNLGLAMLYGLPGFVQEAAIVALERHDDDVESMRDSYRRRRDLALELLSEARDLPLLAPPAGMFLMADVRAHDLDATRWAWNLYRATGVSVLDAGAFGAPARGWIRISFAVSDAELAEGCRRIAEFTSR
jgi:arginine:pyruvate transaminase